MIYKRKGQVNAVQVTKAWFKGASPAVPSGTTYNYINNTVIFHKKLIGKFTAKIGDWIIIPESPEDLYRKMNDSHFNSMYEVNNENS